MIMVLETVGGQQAPGRHRFVPQAGRIGNPSQLAAEQR
jgi:hypothetical protein